MLNKQYISNIPNTKGIINEVVFVYCSHSKISIICIYVLNLDSSTCNVFTSYGLLLRPMGMEWSLWELYFYGNACFHNIKTLDILRYVVHHTYPTKVKLNFLFALRM